MWIVCVHHGRIVIPTQLIRASEDRKLWHHMVNNVVIYFHVLVIIIIIIIINGGF